MVQYPGLTAISSSGSTKCLTPPKSPPPLANSLDHRQGRLIRQDHDDKNRHRPGPGLPSAGIGNGRFMSVWSCR